MLDIYDRRLNHPDAKRALEHGLIVMSMTGFYGLQRQLAFGCRDFAALRKNVRSYIENELIWKTGAYRYLSYEKMRDGLLGYFSKKYDREYVEYTIWWSLEVFDPHGYFTDRERLWLYVFENLTSRTKDECFGDAAIFDQYKEIMGDLERFGEDVDSGLDKFVKNDWARFIMGKSQYARFFIVNDLDEACRVNRMRELAASLYPSLSPEARISFYTMASSLIDAAVGDLIVQPGMRPCPLEELVNKHFQIMDLYRRFGSGV